MFTSDVLLHPMFTSDVLPHPMFTSDVRTCRNVYKRLCATEHVCSGASRIFVREGGGGKLFPHSKKKVPHKIKSSPYGEKTPPHSEKKSHGEISPRKEKKRLPTIRNRPLTGTKKALT